MSRHEVENFEDSIRRLTHNADGTWRPDTPEKFIRLYCWLVNRLENKQFSVHHLAILSVFIREIALFQKKTNTFLEAQFFESIIYDFGDAAEYVITVARTSEYREEMEDKIHAFLFIVLHYLGKETLQLFPKSVWAFYTNQLHIGISDDGELFQKQKRLGWRERPSPHVSRGRNSAV